MATRRHVLMGIGYSAVAAAPLRAHAGAKVSGRPASAIFDSRFAAARRFGAAIEGVGLPAKGFAGDITRMWSDTLAAEWREAPRVLVGMTTPGPLFCLERWAWDAGMRVMFRVDHLARTDGSVDHAVAPVVDDGRIARALREAGADYPVRVAGILAGGGHPRACCASAAGLSAAGVPATPLVSWVIAPARQPDDRWS